MAGRDSGGRRSMCLRLDADDIRAVKLEAMRRVEAGESDRIDISRVVREALAAAPWRRRPDRQES